MKARLKIQNFGPIDDLDIEISKFNILIGPHASGKSTIAKLLCVIHSLTNIFPTGSRPFKQKSFPGLISVDQEKYFLIKELLANYRIENFLNENTYLYFDDAFFSFELDGLRVTNSHKKEDVMANSESYYVPAERIALPMISESLFELTLEQSTIPNYFLQFGRDFTISRRNQKLFNLPILKVGFENRDGRNVVIFSNNKLLLLEEASSAIQANLPFLVILQYPMKLASIFVLEELELHGFPTLQKSLLNYVIDRTKKSSLRDAYVILPTHSPYILSAANNLLFAAKIAKQSDENAIEVEEIISKESWINKEDFSAYYISAGTARSIIDEKTGLIHENELDSISEDLAGEFDALMDLYKPVKA